MTFIGRSLRSLVKAFLARLDDFEHWRPRVGRLLMLAAALVLGYWTAWFHDRGLVASDHSAAYVGFEQAFPLADALWLGAMLMAARQLWRRRPSALLWLLSAGGAGIYLCAMDVLYDLEHGIYGVDPVLNRSGNLGGLAS